MNKLIPVLLSLAVIYFSWKASPVSMSNLSINSISKDPPKTVPYVDVARYLGVWYEQASIPMVFERSCEKTMATYSLNTDQTIRVNNTCYRNGAKSQIIGKAFPNPADTNKTNAKLIVEFTVPFVVKGDYWIVRLDKDYTYAVVSNPNYSDLWILCRQPNMPEALYGSIYNDLKNDGFPVEKLKKTIQ